MIFQRLLCQGVPLPGGHFGFELFVPKLVLVIIQPGAQFAELSPGEGAQLLRNFLNSAQNGLRSDISSDSRVSDILMW